jgi:hypothetical protein
MGFEILERLMIMSFKFLVVLVVANGRLCKKDLSAELKIFWLFHSSKCR